VKLARGALEAHPPRRALDRPFVEADAQVSEVAPDLDEPDYAAGKRRAEAVFAREARLPTVCVRIGHVLAGAEDFTGRLASYATRVRQGAPLRHAAAAAPTSFISAGEIAAFLCWVGDAEFTGPVNAASQAWSAVDLHRRVAAVLELPARTEPVAGPVEPAQLSPFDDAAQYVMSTARAGDLGHAFARDDRWLDDAIRSHAGA
jgi:hypothetical protein